MENETAFKLAIGNPSSVTGNNNSAAENNVGESDGNAYLNVIATDEVCDGFGQNGSTEGTYL